MKQFCRYCQKLNKNGEFLTCTALNIERSMKMAKRENKCKCYEYTENDVLELTIIPYKPFEMIRKKPEVKKIEPTFKLCDKKCESCIYHTTFQELTACDYLNVTGIPRPKVEPCTVYEKGTSKEKRQVIREKKPFTVQTEKPKRGRPTIHTPEENKEIYRKYQAEYRAKKRAERMSDKEEQTT